MPKNGGRDLHYFNYNEQKQHGTLDFPIEFYQVDENHSRYNMPFHWHKEMELIRILKGRLLIKVEDEEISAQAGDLILIHEGVIHGGTPENCQYECIVFDIQSLLMHTDACRQYIRNITLHKVVIQNHFTTKDQVIRQAAEQLFHSMKDQSPGSELMILGALFQFFGTIFLNHLYTEASGEPGTGCRKMAQLKPVLEFIDSSYASPVSLGDLSRIAGMTPKYFCQYFHSVIHHTPMDYLNYYRIEQACHRLSTTEISVTEAAYSCGFNDISYFIKTFKRYKGVTPKQYGKGKLEGRFEK